jgi:hypothetical protein
MNKLMDKEDLQFRDGYLIDPDGIIISPQPLIEEVNEIAELDQFVQFLENNEQKILSSGAEPIVFRPKAEDTPRLTTGKTANTPMSDEWERQLEVRAEEWVAKQELLDIEQTLRRYKEIARFIDSDTIVVGPSNLKYPIKFKTNPLLITKEQVIGLVEASASERFKKLAGLVKIDFS